MTQYAKKWKQSTSVIIVAKNENPSKLSSNFKVLGLERVNNSSTYPGATVFPGGVVEKADRSQEWIKLYDKFGFNIDSFESINPKGSKPRIFEPLNPNDIPPYLSLRICAVRETFEETGILMCRNSKIRYEEITYWANFFSHDGLVEWQTKVFNDANEFINLCLHFGVYPDVWSLHEWSNWLAPPIMAYKFDLIYFLAAFQEVPVISMNVCEATRLYWATPQEYLQQFRETKILLLLPQFYEMSRLKIFFYIESLAKFAQERAYYGTETYMSHRIYTNDIVCTALPGDDLYPSSIDLDNKEPAYLECIPDSKIQHRIYFTSLYEMHLVIKNCKPLRNHVLPISSKM